MQMGCCGSRPVSIGALLVAADSLPPNTVAGRRARARLAYTIAAAKAAQVGNRRAYAKAMRGLGELGTGGPTTGYHGSVSTASARVTAAVTHAASGPSLAQVGAQIGAVVNMLASLAGIAASIAQAAGGDATAVAVANTVVSWVRAIVNGTPPTIPTLDANTLGGFVDFCRVGAPIKTAVDLTIGGVITGLSASIAAAGVAGRTPNASEVTAVAVLTSILQRLDGMFDGICAAVAQQATPVPGASSPQCVAAGVIGDNWVFDPVANTCNCAPGYSSAISPGQCLQPPAAPPGGTPFHYQPGLLPFTMPFTLLPTACPTGQVRGADGVCRAPASSGGGLLIPAAIAAIAAKMLFF